MISTGQSIIDQQIIIYAAPTKQDNGLLPSYGPDGCGYTMRGTFIDKSEIVEIPPFKSVSVKTKEIVEMPNDMAGLLYIKSTYARQGIILVTNAPVDPGYNGTLTIRLFNSSEKTVKIYTMGGLAMLIVYKLIDSVPSYNGRHQGKYK